MRKKKPDDIEVTEKEIMYFPLAKKEIQNIINDIVYSTPYYEYDGSQRSNQPSNPTEQRVINFEDHMRLQYLQPWVTSIEFVLRQLDEEKEKFVRNAFWSTPLKDAKVLAEEFSISVKTVYEWKRAFVIRVRDVRGAKRTMV